MFTTIFFCFFSRMQSAHFYKLPAQKISTKHYINTHFLHKQNNQQTHTKHFYPLTIYKLCTKSHQIYTHVLTRQIVTTHYTAKE